MVCGEIGVADIMDGLAVGELAGEELEAGGLAGGELRCFIWEKPKTIRQVRDRAII